MSQEGLCPRFPVALLPEFVGFHGEDGPKNDISDKIFLACLTFLDTLTEKELKRSPHVKTGDKMLVHAIHPGPGDEQSKGDSSDRARRASDRSNPARGRCRLKGETV